MEPPDLDTYLPGLLRRVVRNMPLDAHLEEHMRDILQNEPSRPHRRPQIIAVASVALVVVLALAGFAWLRPHVTQGGTSLAKPTATATLAPTPTTKPAATCSNSSGKASTTGSATYQGITVHLDAAYADASQTYIGFHVTGPGNSPDAYTFAILQDSSILDAHQRAYTGMLNGNADTSNNSTGVSDYSTYLPLVPALQTGTQSLTFVVHKMSFPNQHFRVVTGTWQIPFTVKVVVPQTTVFHVAPITHSGVTVQPVSLEMVCGQQPFLTNDSKGQGARLILSISGLHSPDALRSAPGFESAVQFPDSNGGGTSAGNGSHLTLGGNIPAWSDALSGSQHGDAEEVEVLYWLPLTLSGTTSQLQIDRICLGGTPNTFANGPWSFDLPIP
jgi:hypothetical protein